MIIGAIQIGSNRVKQEFNKYNFFPNFWGGMAEKLTENGQ